jgi:hypothetical protein
MVIPPVTPLPKRLMNPSPRPIGRRADVWTPGTGSEAPPNCQVPFREAARRTYLEVCGHLQQCKDNGLGGAALRSGCQRWRIALGQANPAQAAAPYDWVSKALTCSGSTRALRRLPLLPRQLWKPQRGTTLSRVPAKQAPVTTPWTAPQDPSSLQAHLHRGHPHSPNPTVSGAMPRMEGTHTTTSLTALVLTLEQFPPLGPRVWRATRRAKRASATALRATTQ